MLECDVLVVGAGPAGSVAAAAAAGEGARVLMTEKKQQVGEPVQCAEHIPFQVAADFSIGGATVAQSVSTMRTHLPDGEIVNTPARGVILNRQLFDQHLAGLAVSAGARLLKGVRADSFQAGVAVFVTGSGQMLIRPKVIIGADGAASVVRRWMGLKKNRFVQARQHVLVLSRELDSTEVFFRNWIPGGYGWLFPKGKMANVGVGVERRWGTGPRQALSRLIEELRSAGLVKSSRPAAVTGGLIPVGGQQELVRGNILLAGDAAGHCHPVTGAGVPNAVFAGRLAGEAAAAAAAGHMGALVEYEESCRLFLDDSLRRAVSNRKVLEPYWARDAHGLSKALRKGWIAFDGYYKN